MTKIIKNNPIKYITENQLFLLYNEIFPRALSLSFFEQLFNQSG